MKTVRECCVIPYYGYREIETLCSNETKKQAKYANLTGISALFVQDVAICYLGKTNLMKLNAGKIDANSKFDKEMAKTIYRNFSAINKNFNGVDPWFEVIGKAVDKCEFSTNMTRLRKNIEEFYNCTNNFLLNNCAMVETNDECDETLQVFEKCKGIKPNCTEWPKDIMLPEMCCLYPEVITNEMRVKYRAECAAMKTGTYRESAKCVNERLVQHYKKDEKLDPDLIKKTLKANTNATSWVENIDKAVDSCLVVIQGKNQFFVDFL